jgi:hypothetical protein
MKKSANQGCFFRRSRQIRLLLTIEMMFLAAGLTGCSWFPDTTNPPMIIDASQHPVGYGQQTPPSYNDPRYAQPANAASNRNGAGTSYDPSAQGRQNGYPIPTVPPNAQMQQDPYRLATSSPPPSDRLPVQSSFSDQMYQNNQQIHTESVPVITQTPAAPYSAQNRYNSQVQPAVTDVQISEINRGMIAQAPPVPQTQTIPSQDPTPQTIKAGGTIPIPQSHTAQVTITGLTPGNGQSPPPALASQRGNLSVPELSRQSDAVTPAPIPVAAAAASQPAVKILANPTPEAVQYAQPVQTVQPAVSQQAAPATSIETLDIRTIQNMLEKFLQQQPKDTNVQLALRYLYQAQGLTDKASEPLKDIPVEQQAEALQLAKTFLLAQQASDKTSRDNPALIGEALQSLNQLENRLSENADLEIVNLNLCQDAARGFGQYQPIDKAELEAGKAKTIWIYFELRNFQTRRDEKGKYSSKIGAEITLYDDQFRVVKQMLQAEVPDESYNRRKDFYLHAGPLKLPDLSPGKYQLVVTAEDKNAKKAARPARFDFEIKADQKK